MRSRNVSPGLAVMRTTSQSERTRVPPVTLERSPPLSRMTGAFAGDGAFIDRRDPFDDFAVAWDQLARLPPAQRHPCARRTRRPASTRGVVVRPLSLLARRLGGCFRKVSAWALPRPQPSLRQSWRKSTVNHSQAEMAKMKRGLACGGIRVQSESIPRPVVRMLPTNTVNITGLRS